MANENIWKRFLNLKVILLFSCRLAVSECCLVNVSLLLHMMELSRCGMFELILVWQQLAVALVQSYAWSMMIPLEFLLLLVEMRMFFELTNAIAYFFESLFCYWLLKTNLLNTCITRVANIWDIRAGRQMHKLLGHTKWIRWDVQSIFLLFMIMVNYICEGAMCLSIM